MFKQSDSDKHPKVEMGMANIVKKAKGFEQSIKRLPEVNAKKDLNDRIKTFNKENTARVREDTLREKF